MSCGESVSSAGETGACLPICRSSGSTRPEWRSRDGQRTLCSDISVFFKCAPSIGQSSPRSTDGLQCVHPIVPPTGGTGHACSHSAHTLLQCEWQVKVLKIAMCSFLRLANRALAIQLKIPACSLITHSLQQYGHPACTTCRPANRTA